MIACVQEPTAPTSSVPPPQCSSPVVFGPPNRPASSPPVFGPPNRKRSCSPPPPPPSPPAIPDDLLYYGPLRKPQFWCDYHRQVHDSPCPLTKNDKQTRQGILGELKLNDPKQSIREVCRIYYATFESIALRTMKAMAALPPPKLREIESVYMQLVEANQAIRMTMAVISSDTAYDLGKGKPVSFLAHALILKRSMMEDAICQAFRLSRYIEDVKPVIEEVMSVGKKAFPLLRPFGKRISRNCRNVCQDHCFVASTRETHLMRLLSRVMASASKAGLKVTQACAYEMRNRLLRAQLLNLVDYESTFGFVDSLVRRIERGDFKGRMLDFDGVLYNHLGLVREEPDGKAALAALYEV